MILKMKSGRSAAGLLRYIEAGASQSEPLFSSMSGKNADQLALEAGVLRRLRPGLKKAVGHLILSQDPSERDLSMEEWITALNIAFREHFGDAADRIQFAAYEHKDGGHQHLHVFFLRIDPATGNALSDSWSYKKNEAAARKIEQHFGFKHVQKERDSSLASEKSENATRRFERLNPGKSRKNREKKLNPTAIIEALYGAKTPEEIALRLQKIGIECEFTRRENGQIYGWKMRDAEDAGGTWLKASQISRQLSWPRVEKMMSSEHYSQVAEQDRKKLREKFRRTAAAIDSIQDVAVARAVAMLVNTIARAIERVFGLNEGSLGRIYIDESGRARPQQNDSAQLDARAVEVMSKTLEQTEAAILRDGEHALPLFDSDPDCRSARQIVIDLLQQQRDRETDRENYRHYERDV